MNVGHVFDELLAEVEKPSRYLGNEFNSVHKDLAQVEVRVALAFPDLYDLGLGNLGLHILYAVVNQVPWAWCERAYAPAKDLEAVLRERQLPLWALESRDALSDFDFLGFTLQSELTFTNILNMLDLGGIPVRSAARGEDAPIVAAGGPAVFNPEPLAPFVDIFVIGDGEDAMLEILDVLRATKGQSRAERIAALARLEGVYAPALYPFETLPDGRILPMVGHPKIRKRLTKDLDGATYPVNAVVPFTQQVHDRASLEVLRGCTQGCRFCQAGMTTRPVRQRTLERLDELMQRMLDATGYEEVSLVSLSTCDHSQVRQLVEQTVERARPRRVSVSLPSLRLDSYSVELADMVAETRRTGLTVAPEAASPRLRAVINKWIPDEGLLDMTDGAFARGWTHVKLYFMIGLPTERDDDILAIADLAQRALATGRRHRSDARIHLGVSTFVPKPFTPFQWAEQIGLDETRRKQDVLQEALGRKAAIRFGRHEPEETWLEGLVSRSDRRAGDLIEAAWRLGARFDAWREHLRFDLWLKAIDEVGFDVEGALRARSTDERLPWDHLDILVSPEWLRQDWERAKVLQHAQDCRHRKCHKCGVIDKARELCASMLREHVQDRAKEAAWTRREHVEIVEPKAAMKIWLRTSRTGTARFLSHLEAMTAWARSLRRAQAPLSHSQGFHPHPRMSFSSALATHEESMGEYLEVVLTERVDPVALAARVAASLPIGLGVHGAWEVPLDAAAPMTLARGARYALLFPHEEEGSIRAHVEASLAATHVMATRRTKAGARGGRRNEVEVDIRPMLAWARLREGSAFPVVECELLDVEGRPGKAREWVAKWTTRPTAARVLRTDTLCDRDGAMVSMQDKYVALPVEAVAVVRAAD